MVMGDAVEGDAVEQGGCHSGIAEDAHPIHECGAPGREGTGRRERHRADGPMKNRDEKPARCCNELTVAISFLRNSISEEYGAEEYGAYCGGWSLIASELLR